MHRIGIGSRDGWRLQAIRLLRAHLIAPLRGNQHIDTSSPGELPPHDREREWQARFLAAGAELRHAQEAVACLRKHLSRERELSRPLRDEIARLSEAALMAERRADALAQELSGVRDRFETELDSTEEEKTYIAKLLLEKSSALDDKRNRVEFLETALAAAETQCGMLTAEVAKAIDERELHAADCKRREHRAFALAAEAQEQLARMRDEVRVLTDKHQAAEKIMAADRRALAGAADKIAQLEQHLAAQRPLEQEAAMRAAVSAERLVRVERELRALEAKSLRRGKARRDAAGDHGHLSQAQKAMADGDGLRSTGQRFGRQEQWAELLRHLNQLMGLKRRGPSPVSLLASTISYS